MAAVMREIGRMSFACAPGERIMGGAVEFADVVELVDTPS